MSLRREYRPIESGDHLKAHLAKSGGAIEGGLRLRRFIPVQFSVHAEDEGIMVNARNIDTIPAGVNLFRDVTEEDIFAGCVSVLSRRNLEVPTDEQMPKINRLLERDIAARETIRAIINLGM